VHLEQVGPAGWGSHRLHNAVGPSMTWADGWAIWHWHGIRVPQWVITHPTIEKIQAEPNTEIRRCAIESFGWHNYLDAIAATEVSRQDDPGNPGFELALFDVPIGHNPYSDPVRLLVMQNASLDKDGTRRRYAETVPVTCKTAIEAAAWQFGVTEKVYATMGRAT
jgi:hypothetical protein